MEFGVNHIFIVEVVVIFIINEKNHTPEEKTGIEKAKKCNHNNDDQWN